MPDEGPRPGGWLLAPRVELHWRRWAHEWLLFDGGSGQTHKVDTLTALSLMALEDRPGRATDAPAIAAHIAAELALDDEETAAVLLRLDETLAALERLGLVDGVAGMNAAPLLASLDEAEVSRRLNGDGLGVRSGPFAFRIRSPIPAVADGMRLLYADHPLVAEDEFADYTLELVNGSGVHRWWRPQVRVLFNGLRPFEPLPRDHAYPQLEWAMNWCVAGHAHDYLLLHAAVLERDGCALLLPAPPGSGKSTLCAGLLHRGWRLLTDELAMVSLDDPARPVTPLARPVSLKNASIEVLRGFEPSVVFNAVTHGTTKGSVTHMKLPREHVARMHEPARPRWLVFPRYEAGAEPRLTQRSKADSAIELGRNAFNYLLLGQAGFEALSDVVDHCDCYDFVYSRLDDAAAVFDRLARERREAA